MTSQLKKKIETPKSMGGFTEVQGHVKRLTEKLN